jgi:pyruvate formate lyase activating enzyme
VLIDAVREMDVAPTKTDVGVPKGQVFSIQRYSIQDGPGIRTTVFFKGCPLRCAWCSNPESQNLHAEVMVRQQKCEGCGECVVACPRDAVALVEGAASIDRSLCDLCMECVEACPTGSLEVSGKEITIEEAVHECCQDEPFYRNSGGGVTLSGGEPLYQPDFAQRFLKACKEKGLNTALDTCGYAPWEVFEGILAYTDLVLYDVKHLDPEMHLRGTGVENGLILDNLRKTADSGRASVWIRIPLIPGYNDSEEHAGDLARTVAKMSVEKVSLLNYHEWGRPKYGFLGREYPFGGKDIEDQEKLKRLRDIIEAGGPSVTIGH